MAVRIMKFGEMVTEGFEQKRIEEYSNVSLFNLFNS